MSPLREKREYQCNQVEIVCKKLKMASISDAQVKKMENDCCRLKHGLNIDCLIYIFEYLNTDDLITVCNLDDYFKEIINNYVISKRKVVFNARQTGARGELFKSFEGKIRQISYFNTCNVTEFIRKIAKYCPDGLKDLEINKIPRIGLEKTINCLTKCIKNVRATAHCLRDLERLVLRSSPQEKILYEILLGQFEIPLIKELNWISLLNLKELHLIHLQNIEVECLIDFLRQRPRLEHFVNELSIMDMKRVGEAMADYCGDQIRVFRDQGSYAFGFIHREIIRTRYDFLSKFTCLKEVAISSFYTCGCDLRYPMEKLSQIESLEKLAIYRQRTFDHIVGMTTEIVRSNFVFELLTQANFYQDIRCLVRRDDWLTFNTFGNLKSLEINSDIYPTNCPRIEFLIEYPEIIANVEMVTVSGWRDRVDFFEFIAFVPKLRKLSIHNFGMKLDNKKRAMRPIAIAAEILEKRRNERNNADGTVDSVDIFVSEKQWEILKDIEGIDIAIKFHIKELDVHRDDWVPGIAK